MSKASSYPLKIAISQRVDHDTIRQETRDALDQRWTRLLCELGFLPVLIPNLLSDPAAYLHALQVDGIILSGGNSLRVTAPHAEDVSIARDACEQQVLAYAVQHQLPVLGVCRGMQLIAAAQHDISVALPDHAGTLHPVQRVDATWGPKLGLPASFVVASYHRFGLPAACASSPAFLSRWEIVALADDGSVEALHHRQLPHLGVMWHPEREAQVAFNRHLVQRFFYGNTSPHSSRGLRQPSYAADARPPQMSG